ncbi:hypothetical protein [Frateuria aurantia]|uniref:hypothetical protein n=1 Tax=Frateuria aurantia TaxID=81475 RepID=UPI0012EA8BFD|nr:hypothetical protein [Frateuria aurantia]
MNPVPEIGARFNLRLRNRIANAFAKIASKPPGHACRSKAPVHGKRDLASIHLQWIDANPGPRHFSSLTEEKAPTAEKHTCRRHLSSIPFAIEGIG